MLALQGGELEPEISALREVHEARITEVTLYYRERRAQLLEQKEETARQQAELDRELGQIPEAHRDRHLFLDRWLDLRRALGQLYQNAWRKELQRRADKEPVEDLERTLEAARLLLDVEREEYTQNKMENERQAADLERELGRVEKDLETARGRVDRLKSIGVTKTVSGFLVWAGYTGAYALGVTLGKLLKHHNFDTGSASGSWLYEALFEASGKNKLGAAFALLAVVISCMVVVGGWVWVADWFLRRFDRSWQAESRKLGKKSKRAFDLPRPEFKRSAFVQLIASFPIIFAGLVTVLVLGGPENTNNPALLTQGVLISSVAATVSILATAVGLVYLLHLVRPRWERVEQPTGSLGLLLQNWEIAALVAVLVVAVLVAAFGAKSATSPLRVWGLVALFMTLASLAHAYGLFARGHFLDVFFLERERVDLLENIDLRRRVPTLDLGTWGVETDLRDGLRKRRAEREKFEHQPWHLLDDEVVEKEEHSASRWRRWRAKPRRLLTLIRSRAADLYPPLDETDQERVRTLRGEISESWAELQKRQQLLDEARIRDLEKRRTELVSLLQGLRNHLLELEQWFWHRHTTEVTRHHRLAGEVRGVYAQACWVRDRLYPNDGPPPPGGGAIPEEKAN